MDFFLGGGLKLGVDLTVVRGSPVGSSILQQLAIAILLYKSETVTDLELMRGSWPSILACNCSSLNASLCLVLLTDYIFASD